ncbi:Component of a membrane-bound complex containing the Tor2p kinase [Microbotryomycetes sp. JL221]|nr:Component of a membrane-bound complex containing the Tor2p kinase [Microbotryomycetes sp. JL221]
MSLLADRDFLLHSLRLNYIRSVLPNHAPQAGPPGTGPYNLVSFDSDSSTIASPYVLAANLADADAWPELNSGRSSPPLAPFYGRTDAPTTRAAAAQSRQWSVSASSGAPGLDYTQTIGKGPGGPGMRVSGRRSFKGKRRASDKQLSPDGNTNGDGLQEMVQESLGSRSPLEKSIHRKRLSDQSMSVNPQPPPAFVLHSPAQSPTQSPVESNALAGQRQSGLSHPADSAHMAILSPMITASPLESALMDDRGILRSPADKLRSPLSIIDGERSGFESISSSPAAPSSTNTSPSPSTSAKDTVNASLSQGNGFASDASLSTSLAGASSDEPASRSDIQQPLAPVIAAPRGFRPRERRRVNVSGRLLVPIVEPSHDGQPPPDITASALASGAVRLRTVSEDEKIKRETARNQLERPDSRIEDLSDMDKHGSRSGSRHRPRNHGRHSTELAFERRPQSTAPRKSALTAMLQSQDEGDSSSNPFFRLYAAVIAKSSDALKLKLYFPKSDTPSKPLVVSVKRDVIVEEVIGAGLYSYWEDGRQPAISVDEDGDDVEETTKWNLRIVEDDGEVDEDFPALDRLRTISAFSFGEFAIVPAVGAQIKDNQAKQASITRRPSRVLGPKRTASKQPVAQVEDGSGLTVERNVTGDSITSTSLLPPNIPGGVSSGMASVVTLKVRLPSAPGVDSMTTTLQVPSDMYINDVLVHLCRKRGLDNPKDWTLIVRHNRSNIVVPLDRTVDSLGDRHELVLVHRMLVAGSRSSKPAMLQNTNPSASIFAPRQDVAAGLPKYTTVADMTTSYQKWNVQRKLPVPLGRHPRCIVIDGDYKGLAETGRTSSFHVSAVRDCRLSRRSASAFKVTVARNHGEKRYDFEAEDGKQAADIVHQIKALMATWKVDEAARQARERAML